MKKTLQIKLLLISLVLLTAACSQINKASDFITNPTAKEKYQRDFDISDELYKLWQSRVDLALIDSVSIELPYAEAGKFSPRSFQIYSYEIELQPGEILSFEAETDSVKNLVFIELYQKKGDSTSVFEKVETADFQKKKFCFEPEEAGNYKLVIQPEIEANTPFLFKIQKRPAYIFPVLAGMNNSIQSYWGATRDGGARSHEGIDIFAKRGTPVVAATDGRITYTGEKGLGGKQVWLRDNKRNQSLYYAHLDSIHPISGKVKMGDTLGYVGNTGNARTTPPHLHFGIYKSYRGAIDPLKFVFQTPNLELENSIGEIHPEKLLVTSSRANLRNRPETGNSIVLKTLTANDTLNFLGKVRDWYHVRTFEDKAVYIHQSLVSPI
ncbi:peptidoglycan DD-metalloendopeptidase family protein [Salegentibacter sp.]|uniref:peptidoglycan DD-metalloendopeptidase family protein n=1 Tax=Salegentibacter sp. TaxID=1903072 RepID=UPI003567FD01